MRNITVLKGDGIGPEICSEVVRVLETLKLDLNFEMYEVGEACYEACGELIPQAVFDSIENNKIVLKAPITTPIGKGFKSLNVQLRNKYNLYQNIRPAKSLPNIDTPFKNIDIITFRENTEDLYIGEEVQIDENTVHAIKLITREASTNIAKAAFEYAVANGRKKVTCVHKANILKLSDGLFLSVFNEVAKEYPQIEANTMIVDNTCMQLVMKPEQFDIMVMPNLYGDIVSDLTSGLIGGLGLLPSANLGEDFAMFEAVHGSAPDIAGQNKANPLALLLAACLMLDYLEYRDEATKIRNAIDEVLKEGSVRTADIGGTASTTEFTDAIIAKL
ncbi:MULTISPECIES: isocitrate/isopropylmalate dehydrogenase family protein [unclassified Breznakia]|uniref:isocitrate/isopropylmalate dehydrogenase family protein n=1 Tax=unclassified Breznakia TaxID=2623764 RepID=UPI002475A57C|nr:MULTISPECIES: isocitrate/isopropylmalate dehydrogenase family protein [unclassified Breznakia]MDH6367932.1 isocitrate dehydrogenase (NAD+) [Breznakia sp. PH1-1]MDH6405005.1 isocitrate dehydrogenase (NAD+) [Breznakia sp. PF1-11]MDH6412735.1 isocitrate dehydrogenase (NAD+) [Breznakia sp. PFB1-11]MDH6415080.1 isocitrate dehydrogenase (NAD+) [Breznakia sp. PFB1-14]MDH6417406.1 isocitrate dehydrogenase (NAD+) [Breznakia sp. PFB1-4]